MTLNYNDYKLITRLGIQKVFRQTNQFFFSALENPTFISRI
jgi:hypothetical protein